MYEYALNFKDKYVEIFTYLSTQKLYGEIVEVTPLEVVLQRKHIEKSSSKNNLLYIPINTIISIRSI